MELGLPDRVAIVTGASRGLGFAIAQALERCRLAICACTPAALRRAAVHCVRPTGSAFVRSDLPLGRFGAPEEVAGVVTFLASERASLVTGACWTVDGRQSRSLV